MATKRTDLIYGYLKASGSYVWARFAFDDAFVRQFVFQTGTSGADQTEMMALPYFSPPNALGTSSTTGNVLDPAIVGPAASFPDGTANLPGIYFTNEPGTGFYRAGAGQIGVELSGVNYVTYTTTQAVYKIQLSSTVTTTATSSVTGAVIIGNGTAATNVGIGAGVVWTGTGLVVGTSPTALVGLFTIAAGGSSNQINGYAGAVFIWGMGRDTNGILLDSLDTVTLMTGSSSGARSGVRALTLGTTGDASFIGNVTVASGKDLKLGRARVAGVLVQGGSINLLDNTGATVTVLTT